MKELKAQVNTIGERYELLEAFIKGLIFNVNLRNEEVIDAVEEKLKLLELRLSSWVVLSVAKLYGASRTQAVETLYKIGAVPKNQDLSDESKKSAASLIYGIYKTCNKAILLNVKEFLTLRAYALTQLNKAPKLVIHAGSPKIQNFEAGTYFDKIKQIVSQGMKLRVRTTTAGHQYQATLSRGEIQRNITGYLDREFGKINFVQVATKSGGFRHYNPTYYAKMVARTEMRVVSTQAVKDACAEFDNDLVQVSAHASPCSLCAPLEGEIYSLSGDHPVYHKLDWEPPFHPNCEHHLNPTSDGAIAIANRRAA